MIELHLYDTHAIDDTLTVYDALGKAPASWSRGREFKPCSDSGASNQRC
jgi:hypothetical protein